MSDPNRIYLPEVRHSPVGPSGSDRWMNCKGSNNLIKKLGIDYGASEAAEEGTAAHAVLTRCLTTGEAPWELAGKIVCVGKNEYTVDLDMVEGVQIAIDEVARLRAEYPNGVLYVERELSSVLDDEAFGAGDIIFEVPGVAIIILDYKHGAGVVVEPTKPQTKMYGYYAYEGRSSQMRGANEPTKIICGIIQPRIPHPKGPIRYAPTYDVAEVEEWFATIVLAAMGETREPGALLKVGEWCQFCPVKRANKCPALFEAIKNVDVNIEPKTLSAEELGDMIALMEVIVSVQERLEQEAFHRANAGESIKNRKLVHKKANRVFKDHIVETIETEGQPPQDVIIKLDDALNLSFGLDAYEPPERKTPAKLEKLPMGKEFVARWAYKPDAGLTLAPMSDPRTPVRPLMERMNEEPMPAPKDGVVV